MEKNKINEKESFFEDKYENYIISSIEHLQKYKEYIKLSGKILHYLEKPILYYNCIVHQNTKINPFDFNIIFSFEFIDGEIPYISILTNIFELYLNDNKNYYRCLSKKYNYIFSLDNLKEHEKILENLIDGLENFITLINESLAINVFIFFGQYEYEHIYQINDFLKDEKINFFRIKDLDEKNEKYIIITQLYFMLFNPIETDKCLAKLLFYHKLKDLNIDSIFIKNEKNGNLILKLTETKFGKNIEFELIDRKRKNKLDEMNLVLNEYNDIKNEFLENIKLFNVGKNVDFKKYELVINKYKIIFNDSKNNFKIKKKSNKKSEEYIKCVDFYEKLIELYNKLKIKKERVDKIIDNIIYLCSELVNYSNCEGNDGNKYLLKIRKYIELQKNK